MATSEQNTLNKKFQPYKINTRSTIRNNQSNNKNFQNASEHSAAQPGPCKSNDNINVDFQQEFQALVQDVSQKPDLNLVPAPPRQLPTIERHLITTLSCHNFGNKMRKDGLHWFKRNFEFMSLNLKLIAA